jgi:glycosyltransferase involved in cell wall biosynthesis
VARRLAAGPVAHFCQGYEGGLPHLAPELPRIEEVYAWPLPALVVSTHLGDFLRRRFGRPSALAPPPLDPLFHASPRWRFGPRRRPWIAVPSIFESAVKDVPTALETIRRLRAGGIGAGVLRFTFFPLSARERELLAPDRYLCGVSPLRIARALRGCDILLFTSRAEEGFGLPLLEAMVSRVPAVASRIPSTIDFTAAPCPSSPPGDVGAFAEAARHLLTDRRARTLSAAAAARFRPESGGPAALRAGAVGGGSERPPA